MLFYISYYSIILFLLVIDYYFSNKKMFLYIALLIILLVSGTRFEVGYDYLNYVNYYTNWLPDNLEPLFILSIKLQKVITNNYQIMFFTYSLFTMLFMYSGITKYTKYIKTSLLFYLLIPGLYLTSFSTLRQSIAISIFFFAVYFLVFRNQKSKFIFYGVVASLFHYSAVFPTLIVFIFYKVFKVNYSIYLYISLIVLSITLWKIGFSTFMLSIVSGKYAAYLDMPRDVSIYKLLISNIFMVFIILYQKKSVQKIEDIILINLIFTGMLILNTFADFEHVTRMSHYFTIFQIIIVPKLIYLSKNQSVKMFLLLSFVVYYGLMLAKVIYVDNQQNYHPKMTPYQNYFLSDIDTDLIIHKEYVIC